MLGPVRATVFVLALLGIFALVVAADEPYPTRPVTLVVPFPPGGIADLTARPLAAAMERTLKQPVVITNKPGAAGAVGTQSVAVARPDGYTLLVALVSISTVPEVDAVFARTPAYTRDQFVGLARLNADPPILVVNAERRWKALRELGYPSAEFYIWAGLFAPRATPEPVLAKLRGTVREAVNDPDFKSAMDRQETAVTFKQGEEFQRFFETK